jgi:hypothetical protein
MKRGRTVVSSRHPRWCERRLGSALHDRRPIGGNPIAFWLTIRVRRQDQPIGVATLVEPFCGEVHRRPPRAAGMTGLGIHDDIVKAHGTRQPTGG